METKIKNQKKIKVIHIYKDFDIHNGLIESFLIFAKNFDKKSFEFRLCVFNYRGSSYGAKFQKLGCQLDSLGCSREDNPLIIGKLYSYLKKEQPHIVQTYILKPNLYGRIAAIIARVPVIISTELTLKDQAPTRFKRIRDRFLMPINGYMNNFTDQIICASEGIKRQWETKSTSDRIKVIYSPFDISKLSRIKEELSDKENYRTNGRVVGIVGRLSEEKRHIDLLNAFEEVLKTFPDARLLIVGDGYLRKNLEKKVTEMHLANNITFTGFQENVFTYLKKMDVFVLPSRTEGTPLSILEAMSVGIPVIATNVGGIPEIVIDNETGLLVSPESPLDLANSIKKLLSNPRMMNKMGQKAKALVLQRFNPINFIREHEAVYKSLLIKKNIVIK
jgi:glycosyltransferase involved in cell wall biosynthesis